MSHLNGLEVLCMEIQYKKVGDFLLPEFPEEEKEQEKPTLSYFGVGIRPFVGAFTGS